MIATDPDSIARYRRALSGWLATQPPARTEVERTRQATTFRILFDQRGAASPQR